MPTKEKECTGQDSKKLRLSKDKIIMRRSHHAAMQLCIGSSKCAAGQKHKQHISSCNAPKSLH